jgi:hypothetical protein
MFHGSYLPSDVTFLLKPLNNATLVDVATKEKLIQSGTKHYSEMISPEQHPSATYMQLFEHAWEDNGQRAAGDLLKLAAMLNAAKQGSITLISLARAGTPVGVILKRLLESVFQRDVSHYSVSIIRDRGIDSQALNHILALGHSQESIAFIDGWTGKGVITHELLTSITDYNQRHASHIDPSLWVLADLAGVAAHAATQDDYLIPSSILNATISGLISRSILDDSIAATDFHGCLYYEHLAPQDLSQRYVDDLYQRAKQLAQQPTNAMEQQAVESTTCAPIDTPTDGRAHQVQQLMTRLMQQHGIAHINHIKPGIGEATRVLLRRTPGLLILSKHAGQDIAHMRTLAVEKNIPMVIDSDIAPYQAIAIIKDVHHAAS